MTTTAEQKIRVLVAKPGLDGHDRGAKVVARALRDAGMEVIYTGIRQTPEMIVESALQEDVDVAGISILSGAHMRLIPKLTKALEEQGQQDIMLLIGGTIAEKEVQQLLESGVDAVFPVGTFTTTIVDYIRSNLQPRT